MRLKIRCDGESEKFCKIFWEVNKAQDYTHSVPQNKCSSLTGTIMFNHLFYLNFLYK